MGFMGIARIVNKPVTSTQIHERTLIMSNSLLDGLLGQLQGAPTNQIAQQLGADPATINNAIAAALPMIMGALGHQAQQPGGAGALLQALQAHAGGGLNLGGLLGGLMGGNPGAQATQTAQGSDNAPDDDASDASDDAPDTSNAAPAASAPSAPGGLGGLMGNLGGLGGLLGSLLSGGAAQNSQSDASGILGHIFGNAQSHAQEGLGQASGLSTEKAGQLLAMLAPMVMSHLANHAQTNNLNADGLSAALGQVRDNAQNQGGLVGSLLGAVLGRI
jgi:hypothetical protein